MDTFEMLGVVQQQGAKISANVSNNISELTEAYRQWGLLGALEHDCVSNNQSWCQFTC
jgi:hypothetical protein